VDEWLQDWGNAFTPEEFQKVMNAGTKNIFEHHSQNNSFDKAS